MGNKTVQIKKAKGFGEIMQQIDEANRFPAFRKAVKQFIKYHTS